MSKNIYLDKNQYVPSPKRNSYDKSKLVNGTYNAGFIYPIDWEEVTFGDSVKIDITAALRTMPMVWPIQTPVIAKFYSFYVRYRTLMKNFPDFRFNNKSVVHPFISANKSADFWKTGELGDHLGVPTTYVGKDLVVSRKQFIPPIYEQAPRNYPPVGFYPSPALAYLDILNRVSDVGNVLASLAGRLFMNSPITVKEAKSKTLLIAKNLISDVDGFGRILLIRDFSDNHSGFYRICASWSLNDGSLSSYSSDYYKLDLSDSSTGYFNFAYTGATDLNVENVHTLLSSLADLDVNDPRSISKSDYFIALTDEPSQDPLLSTTTFTSDNFSSADIKFFTGEGIYELSDVDNPFAGSNPEIPLSALIPRAYEACYRSHFQDLINEPFILNGEAQYNRYITNDGDGADDTDYKLFRRNWEADFLTSCKPSPQQGMAPIVGITSAGDITLVKGDGSEYTVHVNVDDNDLPASIDWASQTSEADSSVRRTLLELATSGITINSLRNTNAFQKWLEANYRRGLKFRDQVLSNFGVKLEYKELDMPEFLGGFSIPLDVNTINQTSSSVDGSPLGDIAGNGGFFGRAKHSISHYCDEEGVIMTLMCITPIPVYSQLLSRCWLKQTPVDYYNTQFGKIGNQPVTYEEVCPIQAYNEGKNVHDVFGYQRPWYHLISSVDEVHGKMRNDMAGFLMQRIFGSTPELGAEFLHIDDKQLNDVFVAKEGVTDNYYGQIAIKKFKKTSIPRYNLPSLS